MTNRELYTDADLQDATPAPPEIANEIISEGLAHSADDVVLLGRKVLVRARLPNGAPASFFLPVGTLMHD